MKKVVGYVLAVVGVVVMALGFGTFGDFGFLENIDSNYIAGAGIALVIAGVVVTLMGGRARQKTSEVPIYEGQGKKRQVVGYQRN